MVRLIMFVGKRILKKALVLFFIGYVLLNNSCKKEDEALPPNMKRPSFQVDTVQFWKPIIEKSAYAWNPEDISFTTYEYDFTKSGLMEARRKLFGNKVIDEIKNIKYDDQNRMTSYELPNEFRTVHIIYDMKGKKIREYWEGNLSRLQEWFYNDKGWEIAYKKSDDGRVITMRKNYIHDQSGNILRYDKYDIYPRDLGWDSTLTVQSFTYNQFDSILTDSYFLDNKLLYYNTWSYNERGYRIGVKQYFEGKLMLSEDNFQYDTFNNLTHFERRDASNDIMYDISYEHFKFFTY